MATSAIEQPQTNGLVPASASPAAAASQAPTPPALPKPAPEPLPEVVEDFDTFISTTVKKYVNMSEELGGPLAEQVRKDNTTGHSWNSSELGV